MRTYACEYRCLVCGIAVCAEKRVELFCVKCRTILQRWK